MTAEITNEHRAITRLALTDSLGRKSHAQQLTDVAQAIADYGEQRERRGIERAAALVEHRAAEYRKRPIDINDHPVSWALLDDVLNSPAEIRALLPENEQEAGEFEQRCAAGLACVCHRYRTEEERNAACPVHRGLLSFPSSSTPQAEEPEALRQLRLTCAEGFPSARDKSILTAWEADRRALAEARQDHKRKLRDVIAGCGEDPDSFAFGPLQAVDNLATKLAEAERVVAEMRALWPTAHLDDLDSDDLAGTRPCCVERTPTIGDVRRWLGALPAKPACAEEKP